MISSSHPSSLDGSIRSPSPSRGRVHTNYVTRVNRDLLACDSGPMSTEVCYCQQSQIYKGSIKNLQCTVKLRNWQQELWKIMVEIAIDNWEGIVSLFTSLAIEYI